MEQETETESHVGFVVTPTEILDRVNALDNNVQALNAQIDASAAPTVNAKYKQAWDGFMRRWSAERDSYASYGSRWFATRAMPRLERYQATYEWWAADFARRANARVKGGSKVPQSDPLDVAQTLGRVPWFVWVGAGLAIYELYLRPTNRR